MDKIAEKQGGVWPCDPAKTFGTKSRKTRVMRLLLAHPGLQFAQLAAAAKAELKMDEAKLRTALKDVGGRDMLRYGWMLVDGGGNLYAAYDDPTSMPALHMLQIPSETRERLNGRLAPEPGSAPAAV
jgi:hypothetical protein